MTSFWWFILSFIDEFFVFSLISFISKKYTNVNGKDSNYTNTIDISLTGSCSGGDVSASDRGGGYYNRDWPIIIGTASSGQGLHQQ